MGYKSQERSARSRASTALPQQVWCFGVFAEASDNVRNLLHEIVEERQKVADQQSRRRKVRSTEAERTKLVGGLCLFTVVEERRHWRQRCAKALTLAHGRGLIAKGSFRI